LVPAGVYSCNRNYKKKALMWLLHMEEMDCCKIMHARNGREYRLPELPRFSVDGYCPENTHCLRIFGKFFHGCKCQPFRDHETMNEDTLAELYERTMSRIEQITRVGYEVKVQWECEFDAYKIIEQKPELLTYPIVLHSPLNIRDALYGGRTEVLCLHHTIDENETVQYCDVMSLYPYICKYYKFPIGLPVIHVGDTYKNIEACLQMKGLMYCTILPPKNLFHPVLPFTCNKKLLFCPCRTCVIEQNMIG